MSNLSIEALSGVDLIITPLAPLNLMISPDALQNAMYLRNRLIDLNGLEDGQTIVWSESENKFVPGNATGGGGSGTVTSVTLSVPAYMSVTGSPITAAGTLALAFVSQTQKRFFASPSGADGLPTFRAISDVDLPDISSTYALKTYVDSAVGAIDLSGYVPNTRTVNGHALNSNVTVTKSDVGLGAVENAAASSLYQVIGSYLIAAVTSVALSLPAIFSVSGSPVTSTGTLSATLATQSANRVWAGPASGSAAAPTFRAMVAADVPDLSSLYAPAGGGGSSAWGSITGTLSAQTDLQAALDGKLSSTLPNLVFSDTALAAPAAPAVTQAGTPGSTAYSYKIVWRNAVGYSVAGPAAATATGAATLTGTNYNIITPGTAPATATAYAVMRSASGGSPSGTGFIGLATVGSPFHDTGLAAGQGDYLFSADSSQGFAASANANFAIPSSTVETDSFPNFRIGSDWSEFSNDAQSFFGQSPVEIAMHSTGDNRYEAITVIYEATSSWGYGLTVGSLAKNGTPQGVRGLAGSSGSAVDTLTQAHVFYGSAWEGNPNAEITVASVFSADNSIGLGASGTIRTQVGHDTSDLVNGTVGNVGFRSQLSAGAGKWAFLGAGTAASRFGGDVTVVGVLSASNLSGTNTGDQDLSAYLTSVAAAASYQQLDADLTAIAALTTNGFAKRTGTNTWAIDTSTYLTSVTAHNLLSATHGDTLAASVVRGDILVGNSTPAWARLAKPSVLSGLSHDGADVSWVTAEGTGAPVRATSPTLVTPTLGAATATSVNKLAITAPASSATLAIADGKTFTVNQTLTLTGTTGTTMTFPSTSATLARTDAANSFTGVQTLLGNLLFSTDNTLDIGASGATRPRDFFLGRNAVIGGNITGGSTGGGGISAFDIQASRLRVTSGAAFEGTTSGIIIGGIPLGWNASNASSGTYDLSLRRAAAATLQHGDDVNGAAVSQTIQAANGITGTDKTGGNLTIASGKGTGAGAVSSLIFQTPAVLSTGTTAQASTTRLTITEGSFTFADAMNVVLNATTGTKWGTATGQKQSWWGATPVVQQVLATGAGATADNIISMLQTLGLCKQS